MYTLVWWEQHTVKLGGTELCFFDEFGFWIFKVVSWSLWAAFGV